MGISMDPLATLAPEWLLGVNPTTGINIEKLPQLGKNYPKKIQVPSECNRTFPVLCVGIQSTKERNLKEFVNI